MIVIKCFFKNKYVSLINKTSWKEYHSHMKIEGPGTIDKFVFQTLQDRRHSALQLRWR